jgi:hypothetical protein
VIAEQRFALPAFMSAEFAAIRGYWNSLKRGTATMPFTDDFRSGTLGRLSEMIALLEVFEKPLRFRFNLAGRNTVRWYGGELDDRFADELIVRPPLDDFLSQCTATIESGGPTFYRCTPEGSNGKYQRLMFPLWGEGHSNAILAAFESAAPGAPKRISAQK